MTEKYEPNKKFKELTESNKKEPESLPAMVFIR